MVALASAVTVGQQMALGRPPARVGALFRRVWGFLGVGDNRARTMAPDGEGCVVRGGGPTVLRGRWRRGMRQGDATGHAC